MSPTHEYVYGSHPSQFVHLHLPSADRLVAGDGLAADNRLPVAVIVHGGFWRQQYGIELADPLAQDLTRFGVAAAAVEYRRVGDGGGWPTTMADLARAVDHLRTAGQYLARGRLALDRVAAVGHSAGGQLATWLTHRRALRSGTAGSIGPVTAYVPLRGAVSQAGVLDLVGAADERLGNGAVVDLMGGPAGSIPQRYHHASPLAHVGDGARVVCVHGDADDTVPLSQSQRYADAALLAGDPVGLVVLPRVGHMELVDPADPAWETCRGELLQML